MVSHASPLVADQVQPAPAVTSTAKEEPPLAATDWLRGLMS
jgi:hypothetical protein